MTTRIETQNSTYEVDYVERRARRIDGDGDDNSRFPEDLFVWCEYSDAQNMFGRLYFCWPNGKAFISSPILTAEEVSHAR